MSEFVCTRFGFPFATIHSSWFGENVLNAEKAYHLKKHMQEVAKTRPLPTAVTATLVDRSGPDIDGLEFEWVTEV